MLQAEQWAAPRYSSTPEKAGCLEAAVLGGERGGWSGEWCCGHDCGCAESHWSVERMRPACSLNGSGSRTGDQGKAAHMGSAADSRKGVSAWLCLCSPRLHLTSWVCYHLDKRHDEETIEIKGASEATTQYNPF